MNKIFRFFLYLWPFLLIACSDSDPNPWLGHQPEPMGIYEVKGDIESLQDGITRIDERTLAFVLYAPLSSEVHLLGDFNNWDSETAFQLQQEGDRFYIFLKGFEQDKDYACQYLVDRTTRIADPYATSILDPQDKWIDSTIYPGLYPYPQGAKGELAMLVTTRIDSYAWEVADFRLADPNQMVIYELLIRDFTEDRSIKAVNDKLPYLKELGVNAIQLMPFNEFEGNISWGYNPSYYFAPDKAYGTPQDYKRFIDACHKEGIAVIMDLVLNHAFDQSAFVKLAKDQSGNIDPSNPWFNVESPNPVYEWGQDFNHESKVTQALVDSICSFWMSEYKIDGFRFDFTKGFTNTPGDGWAYDSARIHILKRMVDEIWRRNKHAIVIFEHLTDNKEEKELAEHGIYLWGNMNHNYNQATMGYEQNDLNWTAYTQRGWTKPHLVSYMESHDEERLMFKNLAFGNSNGTYNIKDLETALQRTEAAAAFFFSVPGPKMIWQFGERGYDIELNDDRLAIKPSLWTYMDEPARRKLYERYSTFIHLRQNNPAFGTSNFRIEAGENELKSILLRDPKAYIFTVANLSMDVVHQTFDLESSGVWTDYFSKEVVSKTAQVSLSLNPGEYKILIQK